MCQKLGVYQILPAEAPQYDISSDGESRPDEVPVEVAPSDHSNKGEWWPDDVDLNTVTIGNNLLKQMASEVGTEKSQLTPVQEKQL